MKRIVAAVLIALSLAGCAGGGGEILAGGGGGNLSSASSTWNKDIWRDAEQRNGGG